MTEAPSPGLPAAIAAFAFLAALPPAPAAAYDMDCKVILCMAGGFPAGCADAKAYMISRITARPPKLPFGFCAMSDGSGYENHTTMAYRPRRTEAAGYYCGAGRQLFFSHERDDGDDRTTAFCYTHISTRRVSMGKGEWEMRTTYHGRSGTTAINYEVQINVEPGAAQEYRSPLYAINYRTGFVGER